MSEEYKKTCKYLNYVEHLLILASTVTVCISISAFASLVCVAGGITSSAVGIKICTITAGIKKHESIIKEKKKHDKIVLLGKDKLNTIEVLISETLIDSYISHGEFVSVNNLLRKYNEMRKEIKNPEIHYINMVDTSRKTYERNSIETIVDNDGILWLYEKHIKEGLRHKNLQEITIKYHSGHRKHRYELVKEPKKQVNRIFIDKKNSNQSNYGL